MSARWIPLLVVLFACLPVEVRGEEGAGGLTLEQLEGRAVESYPEVRAARAKVARLEAELSEIRWRPFSNIRVQGLVAPTPERRGDALASAQDDLSFTGEMGVLVRAELDLSIPIYTFGRHTAQRDAARERVEVGRADLELTRSQVREKVVRAYFALQLAENSRSLLKEGQGYIVRAQEFIDRSLEEDDGVVTESDRLRVEVLAAEVEARLSDARRAVALAKAALKVPAGLDEDDEIATPPLEPTPFELDELERYRARAEAQRPEVKAAKALVRAEELQVKAERARYLPALTVDGYLDYAYSNVIDDQLNPFVNDPGNYFHFGIGLSLRWDLDFATDWARVNQAEARLEGAKARAEQANLEVAHRVERAYIDVAAYQKLVSARRRGRRASRGWLFSVMQGIDLGVLEPPELVDALRAYFEQSFLYYEAVARHEIALGELRIASGELESGPAEGANAGESGEDENE